MNILKRESTLEKDLEEKIRKKLTLTEIIVLEEPPAELPELTPEMLKTINYAVINFTSLYIENGFNSCILNEFLLWFV